MSAAVEHTGDREFVTRFYNMPAGRPLGGKAGKVVACPKCGRGAWKKSAREYVHEAITRLQPTNEPSIERTNGCDLSKHESELVAGGKPIPKKEAK